MAAQKKLITPRKAFIKSPRTLSFSIMFSIGILTFLNIYLLPKGADSEFKALTKTEKKTIYPAQYSDSHITSNAIISDPNLRNKIAFNKGSLLANTISSFKPSKFKSLNGGKENGTWLWTPPLDQTENYRSEIIAKAKAGGIKNIYLSIDSYLDIFVLPDGEEKDIATREFDKAVEDFITLAHRNNINVDAEGGWRNWAEIGNSYKAFAVLDYAINYNKNHLEKFRGFQFDVEPYLLESYRENKVGALGNFVNLIDEAVARLDSTDLEISVVIPEFYDGNSSETPKFFYAGENTYAFNHLLKILDRRDGSKIIIMSYRNFSNGDDGTIDVSKEEIEVADSFKTKIIVAQETGNVNPAYITFFNTNKSYFDKQSALIEQAFSKNKSYGGTATHYVNAYLDLK